MVDVLVVVALTTGTTLIGRKVLKRFDRTLVKAEKKVVSFIEANGVEETVGQ